MASHVYSLFRRDVSESQRLWLRLSENGALTVVAALGVAVPLLGGPQPALPWDGASGVALQLGALLLLALALWRAAGPASVGHALEFARRGPTPWLLGLLAWGLASCALSGGTTAALQGTLQLAGGLTVYAAVAAGTRRGRDYRLLLDALAAVTVLVSLLGVAHSVTSGSASFGGLFNHRLLGVFLMLMVPVMLVYSWNAVRSWQRQLAWAAVGLGVLGLLAAHWPPALRGAALALLLVGLLSWRLGLLPRRDTPAAVPAGPSSRRSSSHSGRSRGGRRGRSAAPPLDRRRLGLWALYGLIGLASVTLFLALTPRGVLLLRHTRPALAAAAARAGSLAHHLAALPLREGHTEEVGRPTRGAVLAMIRARPVQGWGIGGFAVSQEPFTHQGDDAAAVRRRGPRPIDRAQSSYLRLAAELGVPGLLLWVGALASFFLVGGRALRQGGGDPLRRRVLVGCLAAVAAQAVDGLTEDPWQYAALALPLWLLLGLGVAAAGAGAELPVTPPADGAAATPAAPVTPARVAGVCLVSAVYLALIMRVIG